MSLVLLAFASSAHAGVVFDGPELLVEVDVHSVSLTATGAPPFSVWRADPTCAAGPDAGWVVGRSAHVTPLSGDVLTLYTGAVRVEIGPEVLSVFVGSDPVSVVALDPSGLLLPAVQGRVCALAPPSVGTCDPLAPQCEGFINVCDPGSPSWLTSGAEGALAEVTCLVDISWGAGG